MLAKLVQQAKANEILSDVEGGNFKNWAYHVIFIYMYVSVEM